MASNAGGGVREDQAPAPILGQAAPVYPEERAIAVLHRWRAAGEVSYFAAHKGVDEAQAAGMLAGLLDRQGKRAFAAASQGDSAFLSAWIDAGLPVNMTHPAGGLTLLHHGAASGAREIVMALLATGRCDVLLRDARGRLAWELCDDEALAALLMQEMGNRARADGIALTLRPPSILRSLGPS